MYTIQESELVPFTPKPELLEKWKSSPNLNLLDGSTIDWNDIRRTATGRNGVTVIRVTCGRCGVVRWQQLQNTILPSRYRERYAFTGLCTHCRVHYYPPPKGLRKGTGKERQIKTDGYVLRLCYMLPEEQQPIAYATSQKAKGNGALVLEHRLVMALHIGRPLEEYETVHHINGNKQDNRIENLRLYTSQHGRGSDGFYQELQEALAEITRLHARIAELEG